MRLSAVPELPQKFVECLEECGLKTDVEFLSTPTVEILRNMLPSSITRAEIGIYKEMVANAASAPGLVAGSLLKPVSEKMTYEMTFELPSSLATLSHVLSPHNGRVVELSGHPESKRSEFLLNLVLRYLAKNTHKIVHWVDTTGDFSPDRASNIASYSRTNGGPTCLERIHLSLALEIEQLYDVFDGVTSPLMADKSIDIPAIGYLIIDDISSLLGPLLSATSSQGHALMVNLMHQLKTLAQDCSITVIVRLHQRQPDSHSQANWQVINNSTGLRRNTYEVNKKPALGPTFTFLTDATLWITADKNNQPTNAVNPQNEEGGGVVCHLDLLKSNFSAANVSATCVLRSGLYMDT